MNRLQILTGDCRDILPTLEAASVQTCVTSPPYWGLRDYGTAQWEGGDAGCEHSVQRWEGEKQTQGAQSGHASEADRLNRKQCKCGARRIDSQLGLEATPEEYIANMVAVFREVWRVLRDDGTLWVNIGDSYCSTDKWGGGVGGNNGKHTVAEDGSVPSWAIRSKRPAIPGLKPKDLCMMPARLAMALQADGWYLRSEIVWHKPNPMPESCTDRPTKSHEMIYLLTKNGGNPLIWRARDTGEWSYKPDFSEMIPARKIDKTSSTLTTNGAKGPRPGDKYYRNDGRYDDEPHVEEEETPRWKGFDYFYDAEAIREPAINAGRTVEYNGSQKNCAIDPVLRTRITSDRLVGENRNKRTVWTIATQPYAEAHFATFPKQLPKLCILAGSKPGDTILDPFAGSGTVGQVALELGRRAVLIELNPDYIEFIETRTNVTPGFL